MGKVVLNICKEKEVGAHITAHIERQKTVTREDGTTTSERFVPSSVRDESRMSLNKVLIGGDTPRAELVNNRIKECGIKKVRADQVRSHLVVMTGTHEEMKNLENNGKLDEWCKDAIGLAQKMYGKENVVQAVLHMDEKTPHIHFTCVPLLQAETKHQKKDPESAKKGGRKAKSATEWRLCSKEVFCPQNARIWQDWAGETMKKYGLERGVIADTPVKSLTTSEWVEQEAKKIANEKAELGDAERALNELYDERITLSEENRELKRDIKDQQGYMGYLEEETGKLSTEISNLNQQADNIIEQRNAEIQTLQLQVKKLNDQKNTLIQENDQINLKRRNKEIDAVSSFFGPIILKSTSWAQNLKNTFQEVSNRTLTLLQVGLATVVSGVFKQKNENIELNNVVLKLKNDHVLAKNHGEEDYSYSNLTDFVQNKLDERGQKHSIQRRKGMGI